MKIAFSLLALAVCSPGAEVGRVRQWAPHDIEFSASAVRPWDSFPLRVTFAQRGRQIVLDGFWCGGRTWKVRFAAPTAGRWTWRSASEDPAMNARSGALEAAAPAAEDLRTNPNYRGHLRIADNRRFLAHADGTPFFFLGDTNWSVNTARCRPGGAFDEWLADRRRKGFTAVLGQYFYPQESNEAGYGFPRNRTDSGDFSELNPAYFAALDGRIHAIWSAGLAFAAHPRWISIIRISLDDAKKVSRYLMSRYGAYNLIWSLSGEYDKAKNVANPYGGRLPAPGEKPPERKTGGPYPNKPWHEAWAWNELGQAMQTWNAYRHPMTIHPLRRSSAEFHHAPWLDHNWVQSGQSAKGLPYLLKALREDYSLEPVKPVILAEGWYEREGNEGAAPSDVRWQAWASFLNGAAGFGYGANGIWQFHDPEDPTRENRNVKANTDPWRVALAYPGSGQMRHVRDFFGGLEWWRFVPAMSGPAADATADTLAPQAAAAPGLHVAYVPAGNQGRAIPLAGLKPGVYLARWFNPREGGYLPAGRVRAGAEGGIELPPRPAPADEDWVCELRAAP